MQHLQVAFKFTSSWIGRVGQTIHTSPMGRTVRLRLPEAGEPHVLRSSSLRVANSSIAFINFARLCDTRTGLASIATFSKLSRSMICWFLGLMAKKKGYKVQVSRSTANIPVSVASLDYLQWHFCSNWAFERPTKPHGRNSLLSLEHGGWISGMTWLCSTSTK